MSKLFNRRATVLLPLAFVAACTATAGEKPPEPDSAGDGGSPPKQPDAVAATKITVASVQMIQDCPDTEPAQAPAPSETAKPAGDPAPADEPAMAPARKPSAGSASQPYIADGEGFAAGGFEQPCDQSTVQLALETSHADPVTIEIKAVRVLSGGKTVGTLETRKPKIWKDNSYEPWDQVVTPAVAVKASYKLSMPSWPEVEKQIGESSFEHMFTLEIDVAVDGTVQTVSSPQFPREEPHVIVT